ncbi:MAG: MgtC/SapB family protein [Planctomycetes bacterium]|nr:MgtC/SapB family protein [Planctomycetota bacterium]
MDQLAALLDIIERVGAATLLGGLIGLERELRDQWAGLRTHMMVAIGSALFVAAGNAVAPGQDLTRVIQGVATGIGFIGAGTILKLSEVREIKGLTTASSIWLAGAIGTAAGMGLYLMAVTGTLIALAVLVVLRPIERLIHPD